MPTIQLPDAAARSVLKIIWEQEPAVVFVIDRSGSMAGAPLESAKAAAQGALDVLEDGTAVGVLAFDDAVSVVQAITVIHTNDSSVAGVKAAIGGITAGGATAIGDAARAALNTLLDYGVSNRSAVVCLLTDGESNVGEDPLNVIPDYQQAKVALNGFGYGNDADFRMEEMARGTGGGWYGGLGSLADVRAAFGEAAGMVADLAVCLSGDTGGAGGGGTVPVHVPFAVDASMARLWVSAAWAGIPSDAALWLTAPDSTTVPPASVAQVGGTVSAEFAVDRPMPGAWALDGTRGAGVRVSYFANAATEGMDGFSLKIEAAEYDKDTGEVLAVASLMGEAAVDGAAVTGTLDLRDGTVQSRTFTNAWPGVYMAVFPGRAGSFFGTWKLTVAAGNPDGGAVFTWRDAQIGMLEDGTVPEPEDVPVPCDFSRVATAPVTYPFPVLTVKGGSGSGRYAEGAAVPISAVNPHPGLVVFDGWRGDTQTVANASASATTVTVTNTMGVSAAWRPLPFSDDCLVLDLVNGTTAYTNAPLSGDWDDAHKTDKLVMRKVTPGTFAMGDAAYANSPVHTVTLTEAFYLGVYPVTQRQWHHVNGDWPGSYTGAGRDTHPVARVSYNTIRGASSNWPTVRTVEPNSFMGRIRARMGGGFAFDLPTEAQWEYACRAGTATTYFWGNSLGGAGTYAWYSANSGGHTQPVGLKPANPWGFFDIDGNVSVICLDWYAETAGLTATNPPGASGSLYGWRMRRGCSYVTDSTLLIARSGYRSNYLTPATNFPWTGLRLAWTAGAASALTVNGGLVNTGGVYLAGAVMAIAPEDPGGGQVFSHWEVSPPGAPLGALFRANEPCTVITAPAGGATLTPVWLTEPLHVPDVSYQPVPIVTQSIGVGGADIALAWAAPDTPHTVIGYILEGKAALADELWERPAGEGLLPPAPRSCTVPAAAGLRFFRVTAVVEVDEE